MNTEHLVAVCGLYCGACRVYRAWHDKNQERLNELASQRGWAQEDFHCEGCLSGGSLTKYCRDCAIRLCPQSKAGVTRCADCPDFPCERIIAFNNDGVRHHAEVLANIRRQQKIGIKAWLKEQEERWCCANCGAPVEWYARPCPKCGAPQPHRLPVLPKDKG